MVIILQTRFSNLFSCVETAYFNHKFTLRHCRLITQFKPSSHWSHTPMANKFRRRQYLTFFSNNQYIRSIIHDATRLSNDINKYLFAPVIQKGIGHHFAETHSLLWKLPYFYHKFTLRPWKLSAICRWNFQINFCLGGNGCTFIVHSPWCRNKMATVLQIIFLTSCKFILLLRILLYSYFD